MLLRINRVNPELRKINTAVECLKGGGIIIYPTDTVYGFGCDIFNKQAVERICAIKKINPAKAQFSIICHDLKHLSDYCRQLDTPVYRLLKRNLPGPFTFIVRANSKVPKMFQNRRKTIGIRVPENLIARTIVEQLSNPILSSTVHDDDDILEFATEPVKIHQKFEKLVDMVIDGGPGGNQPSTVIDCTGDVYSIVRQGKGILAE